MANLLFIQFADLETRYVNGNSKNTDAGKEKLVNETEFKIEMLDSTWFTNIVRSEGFAVHGHFRMQACGPNHSQRKLTYINDFEKKGYTRRAKKTIEGDQPVNSIPSNLGGTPPL